MKPQSNILILILCAVLFGCGGGSSTAPSGPSPVNIEGQTGQWEIAFNNGALVELNVADWSGAPTYPQIPSPVLSNGFSIPYWCWIHQSNGNTQSCELNPTATGYKLVFSAPTNPSDGGSAGSVNLTNVAFSSSTAVTGNYSGAPYLTPGGEQSGTFTGTWIPPFNGTWAGSTSGPENYPVSLTLNQNNDYSLQVTGTATGGGNVYTISIFYNGTVGVSNSYYSYVIGNSLINTGQVVGLNIQTPSCDLYVIAGDPYIPSEPLNLLSGLDPITVSKQ